jgi:hypothetical protein
MPVERRQSTARRGNGPGRASKKDMKLNFKHWTLAIAIALGMSAGALQAFEDKDYSKTKQYQQGVREGQDDHAHNKDHSKKRHFKKDEDQRAYESGYQKGFAIVVKI